MLSGHFVINVVGVKGGRGVERFASFGVCTFPAEVFAPLVAPGFGDFRRALTGFPRSLILRNVLPERGPLAVKPPL